MGNIISSKDTNHTLQALDLSYRRGSENLFSALSFSLSAGQLLWLRGQNGSGKTSLLRLIAGLSKPDSGRITWNGLALNDEASDFKASLLYLGHHNGLKDDLTVTESLRFLAQMHARDASSEILATALKRLKIYHRRNLPVRALSQGQRKRVALARLALDSKPSVWVLDEPFDALDDGGIAVVHELLDENLQRGGSVLLTSHIPLRGSPAAATVLDLDKVAAL